MNKYRIGTDVPFQLSVDDGVEFLNLSKCEILKVAMYCDAKEAFAGSCTWKLNEENRTRLDCVYPGDRQVFTGIMRAVVIMRTTDGEKKAYDLKGIFEIVATTEEANATEDTVTSAVLSAWQLPMSTLSTIVEAAINATEAANGSMISEISYTESSEDGGDNVLHIEQADGTKSDFNVRNGSRGPQGPVGPQGPIGPQGNPGSSVDYPFELVNNRTTDDATKALSAAEGKRLGDDIEQNRQDVYGYDTVVERETNLLPDSANTLWRISNGGADLTVTALTRATSNQTFYLNITEYRGKSLKVKAHASYDSYLFFLTAWPSTDTQTSYTFQELIDAGLFASIHFNEGVFVKKYITHDTEKTFEVPSDAMCLFAAHAVIENNQPRDPQFVHLVETVHTDGSVDVLNEAVESLEATQESTGERVEALDETVYGTLQEVEMDGLVFADEIRCSLDKGKYYRNVSNQRAFAIDVAGYKRVQITAGLNAAYLCIGNDSLDLSSNSDITGTDFASTYMATGCEGYVPNDSSAYRMKIDAGSSATIILSENAKWLIIQKNYSSSTIFTPAEVTLVKEELVGGLVDREYTGGAVASGSLISLTQGYLDEQGSQVDDSHFVITSPIPMSRGFEIELHEPYRVHGAMLFDNNGNLVNSREYYKAIDSPNAGRTHYGLAMILPQFYVRLRIGTSVSAGTVNVTDNIISRFVYIDDARLRKMVPTEQSTAAVMGVAKRRARNLLDLVWTALENAAITNSMAAYARKGQTMHGAPYSEAAEYSKYIGQHVSVRTFLTAALNRRSVVYTEMIATSTAASRYGLSYHGLNALSGAYYGAVCSSLTCYIQDLANILTSGVNAHCTRIAGGDDSSEENYYPLVNGVDPFDLIEPLDLIWYTGHITIVTDVYLDENGDKKFFIWTEQTTPVTKSEPYTKEKFKERIIERLQDEDRHAWAIYRYNKWSDGLSEPEATPYVQQDFFDYTPKEAPTIDADITTFAGEYAAFPIGDPADTDNNNKLYLNIHRGGTDGYTHLQIFAATDDETTATPIVELGILSADSYVAQSAIYAEDAATSEDWIIYDLASYWYASQSNRAGKFKARVVRKESGVVVRRSGCTNFQMVDINFQVERGTGSITCTYSSTEGSCYLIRQEKPDGMSTNASALDGNGSKTLSWASFGTYNYVKLFVRADYGVVVKRIDMN